MRRLLTVVVLLAAVTTVSAAPAWASGGASHVVARSEQPYGTSYSQWSNRWWRWALNTPIHNAKGKPGQFIRNGTAGTPASVDCALGQTGDVWFLGGSAPGGPSKPANRTCTVPRGKALFFPVYDAWADNLNFPGQPPFTAGAKELQGTAAGFIDPINRVSTTIDGQAVGALAKNRDCFRVRSGRFDYTLPKDNVISYSFGATFPKGTRTPEPGAYGDGFYLFVTPLSPGQHVLHWKAYTAQGNVQDITYRISVPS